MKCNKCGYEIENEINFCPNCGANLKGEPQVEVKENIIADKPQEEQVVMLTNPKLNILNAATQFLFYFFLGMSVVSFFIGVKGFGLLKREINPLAVWISFGISLASTIGVGIFYYIKFMREK